MSSIVRKSNRIKRLIYGTLNQSIIGKHYVGDFFTNQKNSGNINRKNFRLKSRYCQQSKKSLTYKSDLLSDSTQSSGEEHMIDDEVEEDAKDVVKTSYFLRQHKPLTQRFSVSYPRKRKFSFSSKDINNNRSNHDISRRECFNEDRSMNHHKHHYSKVIKYKDKRKSGKDMTQVSYDSTDDSSITSIKSFSSLSSSSSNNSLNARRFRKKEHRKILRARRRCLPLNFSIDDLNKNEVVKDRLRMGRNLTDIEPMTVDKDINFSYIGGLDHHIKSLKEMVVLPLIYPEVYESLNITPPRGVLFYGPPGTGKTHLARALVNECSLSQIEGDHHQTQQKISFFMRKGSDCLSKWVGESERQLRILFDQAYKMRPSIIFFDEIDGLAPVRSSRQEQIHNSIVSTFLALLDGLDSRNSIVVIGATNRLDAIDPAFRRPGRFDREFLFPMPNKKVREQIFRIHTKKWNPPLGDELFEQLSSQTNGFTGADIKGLCTEAALAALRETYPNIYDTQSKCQIKLVNIQVTKRHFAKAFLTLIPCTLRQSGQPLARQLPTHVSPLLKGQYDQLLSLVEAEMNFKLPKSRSHNYPPTLYSSNNCHEDTDDGSDIHSDHVLNRMTSLMTDRSSFGYLQEDMPNEISLTERVTAHKPRIIITGQNRHFGQTSFIAPALLNSRIFDGFNLSLLDLPTIYASSLKVPEETCGEIFKEAQRLTPSVIFMPRIDHWWPCLSETIRTTLLALIQGVPTSSTLFILATSDKPFDQLDSEIQEIFQTRISLFGHGQLLDSNNGRDGEMISPQHTHVFEMKKPSSNERQKFFAVSFHETFVNLRKIFLEIHVKPLIKLFGQTKYGKKPGHLDLSKDISNKKPPSVLLVDEPSSSTSQHLFPDKKTFKLRHLDSDEIKEMRESEEHTFRELRIFLRDILAQLARDRKFQTFLKPVNPREVPDYYVIVKNPMDLSEIRNKIDSNAYPTATKFLNDIELICRNALEYNPNYTAEDKLIRHRACALLDEARSLIRKQMEPSFGKLCEEIVASRLSRGDDKNFSDLPSPPFLIVPPKNMKDRIFSQYYQEINYDPDYLSKNYRNGGLLNNSCNNIENEPVVEKDRVRTRNQSKTINLNININANGQPVKRQHYRVRTSCELLHSSLPKEPTKEEKETPRLTITATSPSRTFLQDRLKLTSLRNNGIPDGEQLTQNFQSPSHQVVKKAAARKTPIWCRSRKRRHRNGFVPHNAVVVNRSKDSSQECMLLKNDDLVEIKKDEIAENITSASSKECVLLLPEIFNSRFASNSNEWSEIAKNISHIFSPEFRPEFERDTRIAEYSTKISQFCGKIIGILVDLSEKFDLDQLETCRHTITHKLLHKFIQEKDLIVDVNHLSSSSSIQLRLLDFEMNYLEYIITEIDGILKPK